MGENGLGRTLSFGSAAGVALSRIHLLDWLVVFVRRRSKAGHLFVARCFFVVSARSGGFWRVAQRQPVVAVRPLAEMRCLCSRLIRSARDRCIGEPLVGGDCLLRIDGPGTEKAPVERLISVRSLAKLGAFCFATCAQ